MALYIPHSIFRLARLLYVRPETFGPYYVHAILIFLINCMLQIVFLASHYLPHSTHLISSQLQQNDCIYVDASSNNYTQKMGRN